MYIGYNVVNDTKPFDFSFLKSISSDVSLTAPEPESKALGYCIIESNDLFSGSVYDYNKKNISQMSPIKCSDCNQYIYKTDNQCSSYTYDLKYNALAPNVDDSSKLSVFCDPVHPERSNNCIQPHGVCTISTSSKTCNF